MTMSVARLRIPCEVVWVVDEERRYGYGYGTLPGHPESGEERFVIRCDPHGEVRIDIVAFSRPARWFPHLGAPIARRVQSHVTTRHLQAG